MDKLSNDQLKLLQQNNQLLLALLQLWVQDYSLSPKAGQAKVEYRLADAGLSYQEIAQLVGKKPDAVRMLLKRKKDN